MGGIYAILQELLFDPVKWAVKLFLGFVSVVVKYAEYCTTCLNINVGCMRSETSLLAT